MEHFYKNEDGWFNYQDFYTEVVNLKFKNNYYTIGYVWYIYKDK